MFNIDFVFKGKYDRLVQGYSGEFNQIDLSDSKTLDAKVDQIFKDNKHIFGTWFEKSKKSALKATLIEAKTEHIANAVIHLRFKKTEAPKFYPTTERLANAERNSAFSLQKLSDRELTIITRNQDKLYDIFSKSKVITLAVSVNKSSSKLSHVAKHIHKEFAKIRSKELDEESKKKFEENYAIYLKNRQFNCLSRKEIRKCDEYLVNDLKENFFKENGRAIAFNEIKIVKHIKNDEPDLWNRFTSKEKQVLDHCNSLDFI